MIPRRTFLAGMASALAAPALAVDSLTAGAVIQMPPTIEPCDYIDWQGVLDTIDRMFDGATDPADQTDAR